MVDEREGCEAKETKMAEQRKKWERLYKFFRVPAAAGENHLGWLFSTVFA